MELDKDMPVFGKIQGFVESGKQYDLDITLPEDNRNVIYGVVKDCYQEPVCDAVVKLIEIECKMGKEERKPVTHTFTNKDGEFLFGPLCENRMYEVEIWANSVNHKKICMDCKHSGKCLKGVDMDCKMLPPIPPCETK